MMRITDRYWNDIISISLALVPSKIYDYLKYTDIFTEDAIYCGLVSSQHLDKVALGNRSERNTTCVLWVHNQILPKHLRKSTIMLREKNGSDDIYYILHEYGHILHEHVNFDDWNIKPVNSYAAINIYETFAESFAYMYYTTGSKAKVDERTQFYFEILSGLH